MDSGCKTPDPVDALVLDLLEWIGPRARPYAEVIEAWRTSCPRLPVWEGANARGYLIHQHSEESGALVSVSPSGRAALAEHRQIEWSSGPSGESGMRAIPNLTCPLCGRPNECAPAQRGGFDTPCWCAGVTIDNAAISRLAPDERNKACLCRACATAPKPNRVAR